MSDKTDDTEPCQHPDCDNNAIGLFEGNIPPCESMRYYACTEHAPDDVKPVKPLEVNND